MDHLLLPKDPVTSTLTKVPYVCKQKYDRGPFLTYPLRIDKAWIPEIASHGLISPTIYQQFDTCPKEEQESFFQTWLFFGLLYEILDGAFFEEDYIDTTNPGCILLCTEELLPQLNRFWDSRKENVSEESFGQFDHIRDCLFMAAKLWNATHPDFDWRIKYSIAVLSEVVGHGLQEAYTALKLGGDTRLYDGWGSGFCGPQIRSQMLSCGWCPSEIARVSDKFSSPQVLYFISRMQKAGIQRDHGKCTPRLCHSLQIDPKAYQTKHRKPDCRCTAVSPKMDELLTVLGKKVVPLLKIAEVDGDLDSLTVEVVERTAETAYVAISHVWADGLGNPSANAVPRCQVSHLFRMATVLRASSLVLNVAEPGVSNAHDEPVLIWLDTLCCPVSPPAAKSSALALMRQTYGDAEDVLVLDASLEYFNSTDISVAEALMRIFTSGWMARLWTLQEAILARRLWIQFRDKPVFLDFNMMSQLMGSAKTDVRHQAFYTNLVGPYLAIRKGLVRSRPESLPEKPSPILEVGRDLWELDEALHHRSTSVASDEALCIATIMDLDVEELLKVPATAAARMARVWEMIAAKYGGIPQQMLASKQPRLVQKGRRWAFQTLLTTAQGDDEDTELVKLPRKTLWMEPMLGYPMDDGLLVTFRGFTLGVRDSGDHMVRNPWKDIPQIPKWNIVFKANDGMRYEINTNTLDESSPQTLKSLHSLMHSSPCALLLLAATSDHQSQQIWLGHFMIVTPTTDEIIYADMQCYVLVSLMDSRRQLFYNTTEQLARDLRQDPATAAVVRLSSFPASEEYKAAIETLKIRMQEVATEALKDPALYDGLMRISDDNADSVSIYWRFIADWFYHDYTGTWLPEDQKWCID
ncbi:hypothetical protein MMC16_004471 [Acarospora aff. strigata]|nr:hypothetical protein [Acarospora aff. strigata]